MNIIAKKTQGKLKKLIAKFDKDTGATMVLAMGDTNLAGKKEALASLDTAANEIKRLYAGLKSVVTASNQAFTAATEDDTVASMISDLAIIATRIDLATAAITADVEAEVETTAEVETIAEEDEEEVSTSDILDELGIEELEEGGDEEVEALEDEVDALEEVIEDEVIEDEVIEDLEEDFEDEVIEDEIEDEEEMLVEAKKETFKAKRQASKRVVTVSKGSDPLTNLFNFIK